MENLRKYLGISAISAITGFIIGAVIYSNNEKTKIETVTIERTVIWEKKEEVKVVVTVNVDKIIYRDRLISAQKIVEIEDRNRSGDVVFRREMYGLEINDKSQNLESISTSMTTDIKTEEKLTESFKSTESTMTVYLPKYRFGIWADPKYLRDWRRYELKFEHRIGSSPFFVGIGGSMLGCKLGFSGEI